MVEVGGELNEFSHPKVDFGTQMDVFILAPRNWKGDGV